MKSLLRLVPNGLGSRGKRRGCGRTIGSTPHSCRSRLNKSNQDTLPGFLQYLGTVLACPCMNLRHGNGISTFTFRRQGPTASPNLSPLSSTSKTFHLNKWNLCILRPTPPLLPPPPPYKVEIYPPTVFPLSPTN